MIPTDYASLPGANYSTLKELDKSARHYLQALEHKRESTPALEMGIATHLAVFEPRRFHDEVAVWPEDYGRRYGSRWDTFQLECAASRKIILREQDHAFVERLASAVRSSPQAQKYLALDGEAEVPLAWTDPRTGIRCKSRLDWLCEPAIVDLKVVKDASPGGFGRAVVTYQWDFQAAFYSRAVEVARGKRLPFVFLAAEKAEPLVVQAYRVPEDVLERGAEKADELLSKLVELRATWAQRASWPGYATTEIDLELPRWATWEDEDLSDIGLDFGEERAA
jgi:hypothetical protein